MKFIRTKDKIYGVKSGPDNDGWYKTGKGIICLPEKYIISESNHIEELCDELVFVFNHSNSSNHSEIWHLYHEILLKEEVENALDDGFRASKEEVKNIYGAIWTDKGLIYVAKMNEKGELELL